MNDDFGAAVVGFLVGAMLMTLICGGIRGCQESANRQDAIDHGVGEYYLDAEHVKRFRWVEKLDE